MKMMTVSAILALALSGCQALTQNDPAPGSSASSSPEEVIPVPLFAQADSYFLYAFAIRDARGGSNTAYTETSAGSVTYTFSNHIIHECGSHLNGKITQTTNGSTVAVKADFPLVENNPNDIRNFVYDIVEENGNPSNSSGYTWVNGQKYRIADIIGVSGYYIYLITQ